MIPNRVEIEREVEAIVHVFARSKPNCAGTFRNFAQRLSLVGLNDAAAERLARKHFPGSAKAFDGEVSEGRTRPLSLREDYQKRLDRAVARGGRLN